MDSDRYETTVKRSKNILVFKLIFDYPWKASVNQTDVLQIVICGQKLPAELLKYTNSQGCLELF